jgi:Sigma-70 region 2
MPAPLVEASKNGSSRERVFERFTQSRLERAYRLAAVILRDPFEAEDAVHEAAIQAWLQLPALRDETRMDAWFDRILVNECRARAGRHRHHADHRRREFSLAGLDGRWTTCFHRQHRRECQRVRTLASGYRRWQREPRWGIARRAQRRRLHDVRLCRRLFLPRVPLRVLAACPVSVASDQLSPLGGQF